MSKLPPMPTRTIHVSLSVRSTLGWRDSQLQGLFRISQGGACLDAREAREHLMDCLASGQEFLPMGPCDGFDPLSGCPGHAIGPIAVCASEVAADQLSRARLNVLSTKLAQQLGEIEGNQP
jgi:hypothetical protein